MLQSTGSRCTGLVALRHVDLPQTRDQTSIPRTGRQILIHCTTREVLKLLFNDISNTQLDSASEKAKLVSQAKIPFEACLYLALLLSLPS